MVRLKVSLSSYERTVKVFQFHYGTIKSPHYRSIFIDEVLFQFHYGTIKSMLADAACSFGRAFQFHYGTIKRQIGSKKVKEAWHFNSTMVRLKETFKKIFISVFQISIPLWYD